MDLEYLDEFLWLCKVNNKMGKMANNRKTPVMALQELAVKKGFPVPQYEIVDSILGTHNDRFDCRVKACGMEAEGTGTSKQISKHEAAYKLLKLLEEGGIYDPKELPVQEFQVEVAGLENGSSVEAPVNWIGPLIEMCAKTKIEDPMFKEISAVGLSHSREFTYECRIGSLKTLAVGRTIKMAKHLAAKEMLEKLKDNDILSILILENPKKDHQQRYNKLMTSVVRNKMAKLKDFITVFHDLMEKYEKNSDVFINDLRERTEESLVRILKQLKLKHDILVVKDESPVIIVLHVNCNVPYAVMGMGATVEQAKEEALDETFLLLDGLIQQ
ncbi:double-stranded RNA-binding protein Staufen homolog 2 isoform X2 [Diabrotica virgifera virgifera]|uniref:DRBM domain-containing protein n=1 Tax=Diabrotica virgifera virgifera TaxID=50390 RepID=A0ABM5K1W9_DIAVI|nr:double-stranded RNA-binding protein Staufen homolog 2 isoform X2 [Diabrotica virgifera virgifera]